MCLIINHFVMYYSNPQVNYMVTVFIRLVIAVVYTLHLLSCSKCFVCLCLFQYRHCFLVGWCTNKRDTVSWLVGVQIKVVIATSDLWLFIHASNLLPLNSPTPLPYTCRLLQCLYNPCVQLRASTCVCTLKIPNTGSQTTVWTHENTAHTDRNR